MPQHLRDVLARASLHPAEPTPPTRSASGHGPSVLAWPAWRRVAAIAPALGLLWLAVWWAMVEVAPL